MALHVRFVFWKGGKGGATVRKVGELQGVNVESQLAGADACSLRMSPGGFEREAKGRSPLRAPQA